MFVIHLACFLYHREVDSDGEEVESCNGEEQTSLYGYSVWYAMDVKINAASAESTLEIICACQVCALFTVIITQKSTL